MDPGSDLEQRALARVGQVLGGKWRLDALVGVGGMASVYAATHRVGRRGAVKMLHPEISLDTGARQRFLREGYVANKVGHPGAVSVLDDDTAPDGAVYLVMDLLEGETVEARRRRLGKLSVGEIAWIADQVLDVLAAAHAAGIVHRDIKPDNLFITKDMVVKVLDFGIARLLDDAPGSFKATRTGSTIGTPAFMPPEQALGKKDSIDGRTDQWALGATVFDLLTGRTVHEGETLNQLLLAAMTKPAPSLLEVSPGISRPFAAVIDRALAFDREARFPDARAMQQALRAAVAGARPVPRPGDADPLGQTVQNQDSAVPAAPASLGVSRLTPSPLLVPSETAATASPVSTDRLAPAPPAAPGKRSLLSAGLGAVLGAACVAGLIAWRVVAHGGGVSPGGSATGAPSAPPVATAAPPSAEPSTAPTPSAPEPVVAPVPPSASASASAPVTSAAKSPKPPVRPPTKKGVLDKW